MDYLVEINKKVQQKLNLKHDVIVKRVYQQMLNRHNEYCGCDYCQHLIEYTRLKIRAHQINKQITEDYYMNLSNIIPSEINLAYVKHKARVLKIEKDKLKQL